MRSGWVAASVLALLTMAASVAEAHDPTGEAEAVALVKRGVAYIRAQGRDRGFAEIINKQGRFTRGDLYLVVYGMDGRVFAHGANARLVGRNLMEMRDIDGRAVIRERVELAQTHLSFWQEYQYTNPVTQHIERKRTYCERLDELIVCGGVYGR